MINQQPLAGVNVHKIRLLERDKSNMASKISIKTRNQASKMHNLTQNEDISATNQLSSMLKVNPGDVAPNKIFNKSFDKDSEYSSRTRLNK